MSKYRLHTLRALYAFIAIGLALTIWPEILLGDGGNANADTVVASLLGALGVMSLFGVFYPLKMLPLLIFEFFWKIIWTLAFALPVALNKGLDTYATDTLFACVLGLILVPLALPWKYLFTRYFTTDTPPHSQS